MGSDTRRRPWTAMATFLVVQAVLGCWWAALYPGLFSRDSVLYLSHTLVGPWVSDHSVLYDGLVWLSFTGTGDLGAVTFAQTTAMAGALTYLARSLVRLGAPRVATTAVAMLMPLAPPVGAFTVTLWKDVPFTICAVLIAGACARVAARRAVTVPALVWLSTLFVLLGLFRANGFLVVAVAVPVMVLIVRTMRVRLLLAGAFAAAIPLLLNNLVFPQYGIVPPSRTYVYHTAFGDIAVAYRENPEWFTPADISLLTSVAPLERWWEGGACATINPLIWRKDFSWWQAGMHATELLELWRRLLVTEPATVVRTRLCRGAIAWRPVQDELTTGGMTYRLSRRPNADTYVGPHEVTDFPERWVFSLRPLSMELNRVAEPWLDRALVPEWDWVLWRGASWAYLSYLAAALAAWALRSRYVLMVVAGVAAQQVVVLANISAQDFRYMAAPILVGVLLVPLLAGSVVRLLVRLVTWPFRRSRRRRSMTRPHIAPPLDAERVGSVPASGPEAERVQAAHQPGAEV
ncbi:hypothetical protein AB0C27_24705 [Nonomuraea sp. NPDC048882]|uniref:hypothetical protein n=1 Tax=Nonomuraea sp. NPDC048882 TaxID=3154347 RepID=UPI0033E8D4E8